MIADARLYAAALDPALGESRTVAAWKSKPSFQTAACPERAGVASLVEVLVPLRQQSRRSNGRLATNLWLLGITLALACCSTSRWRWAPRMFAQSGIGLLQAVRCQGAIASFIVALLALDGATYLAHRLMHQMPILWRVHLVHHIDHLWTRRLRFVSTRSKVCCASALSPRLPGAWARRRRQSPSIACSARSTRCWSTPNIRVPRGLDRVLVWIWVTPDMHKVHHSREPSETDSNYANLFSFFDRLFRTFTPSSRGPLVRYGIQRLSTRPSSTPSARCLWLPFRGARLACSRRDGSARRRREQ